MKKYIYTLVLLCGFITTAEAQIIPPFGPTTCTTYYYDMDNDGFGGQTAYTGTDIVTPEYRELNKLVCNDSDCDDSNPQINPNSSWAILVDGDGDGHFIIGSIIRSCNPNDPNAVLIGENAVLQNFSYLQLDCDDGNGTLNQSTLYYSDIDNDGFGNIEEIILSCSGSAPAGYVDNAGDNCPDTYGLYNGCPDVTTVEGINTNKNYVHTIAYTQAFDLAELPTVHEKDKIEQVTYFDGMGRGQMQVAIGQSPKDGRDIKTIISYDAFGRANTKFLPYVGTQKGGGFTNKVVGSPNIDPDVNQEIKEQQQFYHNKYREDVPSFTTTNGGLTMLNALENIPDDLLDDIINNTPETGLIYPSYSTNTYDKIGRVTQAAAPGKDWSLEYNHTIKMEYDFNDKITDGVKRYDVTHPSTPEAIALVPNSTSYETGELRKTITKDENWQPGQAKVTDHTTEEYTNKSGQVLLKRTYNGIEVLDTYYIYDDSGNLTYVLPPEASAKASIDTTILNQLCYQYKYDHRNRLIEKKIPAKGWEYIIYDKLDRPLLTQDINLRQQNKWLFTKYDVFGRIAYTGILTNDDDLSDIRLSAKEETNVFESRTTNIQNYGNASLYYTANGFPQSDETIEILTINYYDDYLWDTQNSIEANYNITTDGVTFNPSENTIEKTIGTSWVNAGFISDGVIEGDGYIQYTVTQTDKRVMVGLSKANSAAGNGYDTIDYAIYTGYGDQSRVYVYIDGSFEPSPLTTFAVGDIFRVERSGNQILYKKNGIEFHATAIGNLGTLVGDASFCDFETKLSNVHIGYSVMGQDFTTNVKGLPTGGKVRVLGTDKWITSVSYYDEKGRSIHGASNNAYLGTNDAVSSLLDFSGKVLKSNSTHRKGKENAVAIQDLFTYDKSNRLLYQTKQINSGTKELITKNHYDELGQLVKKQVGGSLPSVSTYTNVVNITESGNTIEKTSANNWNGGLNTTETITGDGYFSFTPLQTTKTIIGGLSDVAGNESYQSIKYSIYATPTGEIRLFDDGTYLTDVSSYVAGDVLTVERRGTQIHYLKNGETFYISTSIDAGQPLLGDIAMYYPTTKLKDVVLVDLDKELQEVDYTYNVRGWLKGINDVDNQGDDLFSFALKYNDISDPTKRLFNGNISSTLWKTKGQDNSLKSYVYDYDALNRIIKAADNVGNYNLDHVGYDLNGNIEKLIRTGHTDANATAFGTMDNLNYTYIGNQLMRVRDESAVDYGFKDGNTGSDDYSYDANGNMVKDLNKGIGTTTTNGITYNYLNLPTHISFVNGSSISYIYDASGVKQEKIVHDASLSSSQSTYYAGNYIYKKSSAQSPMTLTFFNSEEGYIEPVFKSVGVISDFDYVYQYKDHLGNIRLSYQDMNNDGAIDPTTEIKEENHYYPFGLKHKGYNNQVTGRDHTFQEYQGQEFTEDLGLNIHEWKYRVSDPAIGRFWQIDPLAEDYVYNGTYNFAENRVIDGNELEGLEWVDADGNMIYDPNLENEDGSRGGYTSYATENDKKYGDALRTSGDTGSEQFNKLVTSDHEVVVNFHDDSSGLYGLTTPELDKSGEKIEKTVIEIWIGSHEDAIEDPDANLDSIEAEIVKKGNLTVTDLIASTFGHEIDHDDINNKKMIDAEQRGETYRRGLNSETIPTRTGIKIMRDIAKKNKKKKTN